MTKEEISEKSSMRKGEPLPLRPYDDETDPLPGRTPSKAFFAALEAAGKVWRKKR